ncbi:MAG: ABC transporter ATP-binding protein [Gemmatimonadaceae bacterium]|nr:ABC transporter ATP-binding protein [Acetobacteraceae bacterium]
MLRIEGLSKSFGGVVAMKDVSIDFPTGSLTAIIGPNGAGKTTFFNLISGHIRPDAGRVLFGNEDLVGLSSLQIVRRGIGRAFQVASLFPSLTLRDCLLAAIVSHRRKSWGMLGRFPPPGTEAEADGIMDLLGLTPKAGTLASNLAHGDQKLLDIALALAGKPRVLLLDEPTAGMGPDERWQMIAKVQRLWEVQRMTLVFIEHDMDIVFRIAQTIQVLKYGTVLASGTPEEIRRNQDVIDAYLGTDHPAAA